MQKLENGASGDPGVIQVGIAQGQCRQQAAAFAAHPPSFPSAESTGGGRGSSDSGQAPGRRPFPQGFEVWNSSMRFSLVLSVRF